LRLKFVTIDKSMLLLIPLLPFLGFVANAALGRRLPKSVSGGVACLSIVASFVVSFLAIHGIGTGGDDLIHHSTPVREVVFTWLPSGDLQIPFELYLDRLSAVMILVVSGIGSLIHIYSVGYMHEETDAAYAQYFSYLNLFAAFMLLLVLGANFPVMFIGWEGVGLCSYLLIGFWFRKQSAADAGKKAFIVNRIGDFGFIVAMLLLFATFGTLDFQAVATAVSARAAETAAVGVLTAATLLLFLGATGKSAQIPLYVWLPDAMEGPTPVSALIHAATMVTAGVYMIGRNAVLFSHAPTTLAVVAGIGVATALFAGTIGLVQNDIKRVLAYSTVSQLGYMFLGMGVGAFAAGIFHLYTHAFFKALLFLGSGAVIHALAGEQDLRNMGGLKKYLPITYWTFLIGALAIAGVPLLSGFFSKDEILFRTFVGTAANGHHGYPLLWLIGAITSLLTAVYMFRLVFLTFHGERRHAAEASAHPEEEEPVASDVDDARRRSHVARDPSHVARGTSHVGTSHVARDPSHVARGTSHVAGAPHGHGAPHEAPWSMAVPLILLAVGSVVAGYVGVPHALGGANRIESFLEPSFHAAPAEGGAVATAEHGNSGSAEAAHAEESTELMLMALSSGIALAGIGIAFFFWYSRPERAAAVARRFAGVHRLLLNKYYVDEIYDVTVVQPIKQVSTGGLWKSVDAGFIDGAVNGVGLTMRAGSGGLRRIQTGSVRTYAASLFLGVVVILGWYLWG
jgi:NADH-quinone oxidoreductase subunit L